MDNSPNQSTEHLATVENLSAETMDLICADMTERAARYAALSRRVEPEYTSFLQDVLDKMGLKLHSLSLKQLDELGDFEANLFIEIEAYDED
jgi:hypothetical protein